MMKKFGLSFFVEMEIAKEKILHSRVQNSDDQN